MINDDVFKSSVCKVLFGVNRLDLAIVVIYEQNRYILDLNYTRRDNGVHDHQERKTNGE
jgi:hypothetical protein